MAKWGGGEVRWPENKTGGLSGVPVATTQNSASISLLLPSSFHKLTLQVNQLASY